MAKYVTAKARLLDNFLDSSNDSVVEHDLDAVRMVRGVGKYSLNDSFCEFPAGLVLLFNHAHLHSRLDLRSSLAIHDFIMAQGSVTCIGKSQWIGNN